MVTIPVKDPDADSIEAAAWIRTMLKKAGLTQKVAARRLGMTHGSFRSRLSRCYVDASLLFGVARLVGQSVVPVPQIRRSK